MPKPIHQIPRDNFADPRLVIRHPLPPSLARIVEEMSKKYLEMNKDTATLAAVFREYDRIVPLREGCLIRTKSSESMDYIITNDAGRVIGGYIGPASFIEPAFRGRGIATAAILALWNDQICTRYKGFVTGFSEEGYRVRVKAHRMAVEAALDRGDEVAAIVLQDYPDLQFESAPALAAPM